MRNFLLSFFMLLLSETYSKRKVDEQKKNDAITFGKWSMKNKYYPPQFQRKDMI